MTVCSPCFVFLGCPLTYLNPYSVPSEVGISSITPSEEWQATRGRLSNSGQRRKSSSM